MYKAALVLGVIALAATGAFGAWGSPAVLQLFAIASTHAAQRQLARAVAGGARTEERVWWVGVLEQRTAAPRLASGARNPIACAEGWAVERGGLPVYH